MEVGGVDFNGIVVVMSAGPSPCEQAPATKTAAITTPTTQFVRRIGRR